MKSARFADHVKHTKASSSGHEPAFGGGSCRLGVQVEECRVTARLVAWSRVYFVAKRLLFYAAYSG